ncbi:hypothetical protein [Mycobacterium intracellulare]|uniref:hypothetical protein n=1 Tax=Mycobacterium intracellulare TaxID=1767 RepID=UPI001302D114|nr:hypothetical protein [Mycobacterium intracellulare]MCV7324264.1 hypothetical protein [Mycobacterium intracellulare subsp. chimaera]
MPHVRDPAGPEMYVVSWLRWWSVRRRVADLGARVAALEAGRPRIVRVGGVVSPSERGV